MTASEAKKSLAAIADPRKAEAVARYFKTGKGEYGEGDLFIGIIVPALRSAAKNFVALPAVEIEKLLASKIHEHRLAGLEILVMQYEKAAKLKDAVARDQIQKSIVDFYLAHTAAINNWDLVDGSCREIVGEYYALRPKLSSEKDALFQKLARSQNIWERRIAVVSTYAFITRGDFSDIFLLCELLMNDSHDLMHKACGWMLREAGKRDPRPLHAFLKKHAAVMPRSMLRYSLEKFDPEERQFYMKLKPAK